MKRLRKILKWAAICAGAGIALLLMLNALYVWRSGTRLERRLVALRDAGEPLQISDLARPPIPPESNAAVLLARAGDDLDAIQKELTALDPKSGYPTDPLSPADRDRLDQTFAAYPKLMPLLEAAAACPDYDPQFDATLPPTRFLELFMQRTSQHRLLGRVMRARTSLLLAQGHADEALAAQVLVLRLARHWRREPLLIGYLVTVACETVAMDGANAVLQSAPVSPAARQALEAELALHDNADGHLWALRSERAFSLSSAREFPGSGFWLTRGFQNDLTLGLIDLFDRHIDDASRTYTEVVARPSATPPSAGFLNPYGALISLLEPSLAAAREPLERTRALSRSLRLLNALQLHTHTGDGAPEIGKLGLPPAATVDPYNGKPLIVKRLPTGWLVYSVGKDRTDDGGAALGKTDVGFGPIDAAKGP